MHAIVGTLFEGNYHIGAGALINSLHASGYRGTVVCGFRGPRPNWPSNVAGQLDLRFIPVATDDHLTFHKPAFLESLLALDGGAADQVFYFDPDIVVRAPWSVLARWAADGVAVCEDVNNYLPSRHPYRLRWTDFLAENGLPVERSLDRYYNAGFAALPRACASFLTRWRALNPLCAARAGGTQLMKNAAPNDLFHTPDQDALNLAFMSTTVPINAAGPEGMGFIPGGHLLAHAIGSPKPWSGGFLANALRGQAPSPGQRAFFRFTGGPLAIAPAVQLARLRFSLQAASLISRIYRRA